MIAKSQAPMVCEHAQWAVSTSFLCPAENEYRPLVSSASAVCRIMRGPTQIGRFLKTEKWKWTIDDFCHTFGRSNVVAMQNGKFISYLSRMEDDVKLFRVHRSDFWIRMRQWWQYVEATRSFIWKCLSPLKTAPNVSVRDSTLCQWTDAPAKVGRQDKLCTWAEHIAKVSRPPSKSFQIISSPYRSHLPGLFFIHFSEALFVTHLFSLLHSYRLYFSYGR